MRPNYIDLEPFMTVVRRLVRDKFDGDPDGRGFIAHLSQRCDMKPNSLERLLKRDNGIRFDVADHILCRLGCPFLWREEPLLEIYESVVLIDQSPECELAGCEERTHPQFPGSTPPRFCYKQHRRAFWRQKNATKVVAQRQRRRERDAA